KPALRRRSRAERSVPRDRHRNEILDALNSAGAPLTAQELAARLDVKGGERRALDAALTALERVGEVVQNRAGALLVAKRIALLAGRIVGHPDGHGFLEPDDGSPRVFLPPAEVLGHYADPGMEIEIAVRKFELPHQFSKRALAAAHALPDEVRSEDPHGRKDLRELHFVTIDGETARDFDDAVFCRREGKGFRLWVAIADVSHYVRHGDALDVEARERGTSVYFPRRVIPMLPEKLSNGLCSLNPQADRLAMACEMEITPSGEVSGYKFYPAVIRSHARLTYTEVWERLSSKTAKEHLAVLYDVFKVLLGQRERRGAIDFETVETRMLFDARGKIEKIVPEPRNDAHRLIEECMLAANVCAGNFVAEHAHPVLYRVHDVPSAEKVSALRAFLAELGLQLPGGEIPRPADYAQLLQRIRKRPDFALLQTKSG